MLYNFGMILAVVGSQSFVDYTFMKKMLRFHPATKIISGGAKGADTLAERYAHENGILFSCKEFLPQWKLYGKPAGVIRNRKLAEAADEVVAFWDKKSPGTGHTIRFAKELNKPVYIYWPTIDDFFDNLET